MERMSHEIDITGYSYLGWLQAKDLACSWYSVRSMVIRQVPDLQIHVGALGRPPPRFTNGAFGPRKITPRLLGMTPNLIH